MITWTQEIGRFRGETRFMQLENPSSDKISKTSQQFDGLKGIFALTFFHEIMFGW